MNRTSPKREIPTSVRVLLLFLALCAFLIAVDLIGKSAKMFNAENVSATDTSRFDFDHPLVGLALGILATVLVQSSSVTTSTIVAMVSAGTFTIEQAVPMVIGANIGTTITNTLVSVAHVTRSEEFRHAFSAATVHDFFNICSTLVLLPLEVFTGVISRSAHALVEWLDLSAEQGVEFKSPIKHVVSAISKGYLHWLEDLGLGKSASAWVALGTAIALIFLCLAVITRNMRKIIADRVEVALNAVLARSGILGLLIGVVVTVAVQSSSITTSLLVPMCAAGILSLENAYPIMLGANLGTTTTALMSSIVTGPTGLTIALVHCLFNLMGILIFYPIPAMRRIPITLARQLADLTMRFKPLVLGYLLVVFLLLPLGILALLG